MLYNVNISNLYKLLLQNVKKNLPIANLPK